MADEGLGVLGTWSDRPRRNIHADLSRVRLDRESTAVLSRVDGTRSTRDICAHSGLGKEATVAVLTKLLHLGVIIIAGGDAPAASNQPAARSAPSLTDDAAYLAQRGLLGHIPPKPMFLDADPPHGDYVFDHSDLDEPCELPDDLRRDVLFFVNNMDALDHFELLGIEPTDDRKVIRKAFFRFNKRFHPDNFFRKELGKFADRLTRLLGHVNNVEEVLVGDDRFRAAYFRVAAARNAPLVAKRAAEREESLQAAADRKARLEQVAGERKGRALRKAAEKATQAKTEADAAAIADAEAKRKRVADASARKAELQERLRSRTQARRTHKKTLNNPVLRRFAKARAYYDEALECLEKENLNQAASLLQLATSYDPANPTFRETFEKINAQAQEGRAEVYWKRGYFEEHVGRVKEALGEYLKAVDACPRPDYLIHTADLLASTGENLRRAVDLALRATQLDPNKVEYLLTLGKIYEQADLVNKAQATYKRVLELDSKNSSARKQLRVLKRR